MGGSSHLRTKSKLGNNGINWTNNVELLTEKLEGKKSANTDKFTPVENFSFGENSLIALRKFLTSEVLLAQNQFLREIKIFDLIRLLFFLSIFSWILKLLSDMQWYNEEFISISTSPPFLRFICFISSKSQWFLHLSENEFYVNHNEREWWEIQREQIQGQNWEIHDAEVKKRNSFA